MFFIKRKVVFACLSVFVLIVILSAGYWYKGYHDKVTYHTLISDTDIESAWLWDETTGKKYLNPNDTSELVKYLNAAKFLSTNDELRGTTNPCGAGVRLKSGKNIGVFGCGDSFQIQRNDNTLEGTSHNYFVMSKEFRNFYKRIYETGSIK